MSAFRGDTRFARVMPALCLALLAGTAAAQSPVYLNNFADGLSPGWSTNRHYAPRAGSSLLGRFHNESVTLTLNNLPVHAGVVIAMDVHLIGEWTGEGRGGAQPTTLTVTLDDGTLLSCSLANDNGDASRRQSYPDAVGEGRTHPAAMDAYKVNELGVRDDQGRALADSVYRLVFSVPHSAGNARLTLRAANLPGTLDSASWAVDNVVAYTVSDAADLERFKPVARDAVLRTSLGLGVNDARPAVLDDRPLPRGMMATEIAGNAGGFEMVRVRRSAPDDSILAGALDAETRLGLPPAPTSLTSKSPELALSAARELALGPKEAESPYAQLPSYAARLRPEQPVIRRVSTLAYQSRFNEAPGEQWDKKAHGIAPRGERFAGPFGNEQATLKLGDLPDHDQLIVEADLYTIGNWTGSGPDASKITITLDGQTLLADTFANEDGTLKRTQSYPSGGGNSRAHLPGADAASIDALGFVPPGEKVEGAVGDATYRVRFVVPHSASSGVLRFAAKGLPTSGAPAAWGLDNITVVAGGDKAMSFGDATGTEPDDNADDGDYMNPFVRAPGPEWSVRSFETSPSGESFLGRLHNQTAALTVRNFPSHSHLVIAADVVVVGDWQGNTPDPSRFSVTLSDGTVVCATSFASDGGAADATQDFPDAGHASNLPGAGAFSVGAMGYAPRGSKAASDAVYRLIFTVPHAGAKETISFTVTGLRGDASKASWGLDNVAVSAIDSESMAFGGGGTSLGDTGALALGNPSGGGFGGGSPMSNNPVIDPRTSEPFPGSTDDGHDRDRGGNPHPPVAPAPGAVPAVVVGVAVAAFRRQRK